jgi:uncharacterized protein (DUF2141 family)
MNTFTIMQKMSFKSLAFSGLLAASQLSQAANIELTITGIKKVEGTIMLAAYNSAETMGNPDKAWQKRMQKVDKAEISMSFTDVAPGQYAISIFQDLDGDFRLKTNIVGIPVEPYGFSNNPTLYGAPTFEKVAFTVGEQDQHINISLD